MAQSRADRLKTRGKRQRPFLSHAMGQGREFLHGVDNFIRTYGPTMKQVAQIAAPALAGSNPVLATGVAAVGQAADGYAQLRSQLGD